MPWRRSRLLQKYAKAADHAKSAIGTGSPCGPAAPCRAAASRFHIPVFHATFVPHAIPRPLHTWAASPYGIAVSPYSHTPDVFPHISQQIHIAGPSPHTIRKLQKSDFHFGENSGSCPTNPQPTLSSKHPGPALQSSKPSAGQVPANATDLRLGGGGCRHLLHVRPWSRTHFMGTRTAMVMRARSLTCTAMSYVHGHACTASVNGAHETSKSSANPTHSSALRLRNISANQAPIQLTQNAWGAWASTTTASMSTTGGAAAVCDRAIGPEGPITIKPKVLTA